MSATSWIATAGGAALVVLALCDVFGTLLHPKGPGVLSPYVFRSVWRTAKRLGERAAGAAGPCALVTTAALWSALLIVGWALVYWPHLPGRFSVSEGVRGPTDGDLLDALYLSGVALATLGFGDIVPEANGLRFAVVLEALIGFALLTASITWILSLSPTLARSRALAGRISALLEPGGARLVPGDPPAVLAAVLHDIADQIGAVRVDLIQYPSSYFFRPPDAALAVAPALRRLDRALAEGEVPAEAQSAARAVRAAIEGLATTLRRGPFGLRGDDPLRAYAQDHGADPGAG